MTKLKISSRKYEQTLVAARKTGGNENQAHWQGRLKVVVKQRAVKQQAKAAKKQNPR